MASLTTRLNFPPDFIPNPNPTPRKPVESIEVELSNIGPIKKFAFTVDGPGVYVGRGENGSGKSTMLRAVSKRLGSDASDLSVYDGAARGTLQLGEARLTVTQSRVSNAGELEIVGIEGSLDIGSLVDPGIKNPGKADDYRIKTLIALSGIEPDPKMFHEIAGGEAAYLALGVDETGADVLTLAARVKRAIEQQARAREETAESYLEKYRAAKSASDGAPAGESDETKLAEALAKAQSTFDAMVAENQRADAATEAATLASKKLAELGELSDDPNAIEAMLAELAGDILKCDSRLEEIDREIDRLNDERDAVSFKLSDLDDAVKSASRRQKKAIDAAAKRQQLADAAAAAVPAGYDDWQMVEAAEAVDNARKALESGALIRQAAAKAAEASSHATAAKLASKVARKLRDAAGEVDGALSKLLPKQCPLRVEAGRLVLETDRGKSELYADLSLGERWAVALRFAAQQLPPGGMLTLDQVAWESFAPALQAEIAGYVEKFGVILITAAVADGPLRIEKLATAGDLA